MKMVFGKICKYASLTRFKGQNHLLQSRPCAVFLVTRYLSSATKIYSEKIDKNLELRSAEPILNQIHRRPLVVLFGWMLVQPKHLNKFGDLYIERGFDVLGVQVRPTQVLLPSRAKDVVQKILNYIEFDRNSQQPVVIHGFSVGGYLHGELLVKLNEEPDRFPSMRNRFAGQIFDSPVDLNGIPRGFARVLLKNRFFQNMFEFVLQTYLTVFKRQITDHYTSAQKAFVENRAGIPSLMLFSTADPITNSQLINKVVNGYDRHGIPVFSKCWDDSGHVLHMKKHQKEYVEALNDFIDILNLEDRESTRRAVEN